ncbi:hypothetical protein H4217_000569 [Coemansia sp. RSA 1939]|nr:hypothetical protein H4217_000569 [Coemansia sp. RSA 1939]
MSAQQKIEGLHLPLFTIPISFLLSSPYAAGLHDYDAEDDDDGTHIASSWSMRVLARLASPRHLCASASDAASISIARSLDPLVSASDWYRRMVSFMSWMRSRFCDISLS